MPDSLWREAKGIVAEALDLPPGDREPFVRERCAGQQDLFAEVASLLRADAAAGAFIEHPFEPVPPDEEADLPPSLPAGTTIGAYRLVQEIARLTASLERTERPGQ